jgi:hypothetical protein
MPIQRLISGLLKKLKSSRRRKSPSRYQFDHACEEMKRRLALWDEMPRLPNRGQQVGFLITCWQQTGVPFFSLEIAACLKHQGYEVTLIFDLVDLGLRADDHASVERKLLADIIPECEKYFTVIRMDEQTSPGEEAPSDDAFLKSLLFENFSLILRGETAARNFISGAPHLLPQWKRHTALVRKLLSAKAISWSWLFLPGGVYSVSGIYVHLLQQLHLPFFTYDSGVRELTVSHNGVAAFLDEIPRAARVLEPQLTEAEWKIIETETSQEMETRRQGKDAYALQPAPRAENQDMESDLLLFLNFRADTAAVMRQVAFANVEDWLRNVVAWSLQKGLKLIIRQHPCERLPDYKGSDDYAAIIRSIDPDGKAARFVSAHDQLNSYALIERTKVVLPYTSRVGIEAAILGRPVILGTKCFYGGMNFTRHAQDPETYFFLIERALEHPDPPNLPFQRQARLVYFLVGKCLFAPTVFTPIPSDCFVWMKQPPGELWATPEQQDLLEVLFGQKSFPEIRFRHLLK